MSRTDSSAIRPKASALGRNGGPQTGVHGGRGIHWTTSLAPYLFVFPAFAIVFIFVILAALNTCRLAFTDSTLLRPGKFIGIQNFVKIVHDDYFWTALLNSTLYVVCVVPFMVILPLILANLVKGNSRIMGFFRTSFYTPVVMSAVVVGMIWTNLLDPKGLVNSVLESLHIIHSPIPFLSDRTIPGVRSTIVLIMMLSTIAAFRVFNEIYVLTNGTAGPGGEDITMSMLIQKEGTGIQARTGYASALSLIVLVVVGTMLVLQQIIQKRGEDS